MKKKKTSIFNSPITGLMLAIVSNALVLTVIVILSRYSSINSKYYIIGVLSIIGVVLFTNILFLLGYVKRRRSFRVVFVLLTLTMTLILSIGTFYIYRGNSSIDKIINDMAVEDIEYSLITLDESITLNFLDNEEIAIVKDEYSDLEVETKETLSEYSKSLKYVEYSSYRNLLHAAEDNEYNIMVVPSDFRKLLDNPVDEKIFENSKVLLTFNTQQEEDVSDVDVLKDPFTILMLGNNEGLSDSIIVASFNPVTLRATMTSLARDSYVPIACYSYGSKDKLNHSRAHSRQCIVDTVEDFLDIEIDFYFETDFYALVKTVDVVGGLEINSPVSFGGTLPIEGKIGESETIFVEEGNHLLDGKQAITFARERHNMPNGDFDRQLNQQYVIRELASKIFSTRNIDTLMDVLDVAKDNIVMNIPVRSVSSLMGYALDQINLAPLDGMDAFRIVQTQVAGTTPIIGGMSVVMPYVKDVEESSRLINENVSDDYKRNEVTNFNFSYAEPYKLNLSDPDLAGIAGETLGNDDVEVNSSFMIPNFEGWSLQEIKDWGKNRKIEIFVEEVVGENPGTLIVQNPKNGSYSERPSEIFIKYVTKSREVEPEKEVNMKEITIPDFTGENISVFHAWLGEAASEYGDVIKYSIQRVPDETENDEEVISQNYVGNQVFEDSIVIQFEVNTLVKTEDNSPDGNGDSVEGANEDDE